MTFETPKMPEFKTNRNGYEIRTDIVGMAKNLLIDEYHAKWNSWHIAQKTDPETGQLVTTVGMPEFPGLEQILETARKMYDFVNTGAAKNK